MSLNKPLRTHSYLIRTEPSGVSAVQFSISIGDSYTNAITCEVSVDNSHNMTVGQIFESAYKQFFLMSDEFKKMTIHEG